MNRAPRMNLSAGAAILCAVLVVVLLPEMSHARPPSWLFGRHRRQSDQRMAEIQTLLDLEKLKGVAVPVRTIFGKLNPDTIGRRRRSIPEGANFANLSQDLSSALIDSDTDSVLSQSLDQVPLYQQTEDPREKQSNYQLI